MKNFYAKRSDAVVKLQFFHSAHEGEHLKSVLVDKLRYGRIDRFAVDKNYMEFKREPGKEFFDTKINSNLFIQFSQFFENFKKSKLT